MKTEDIIRMLEVLRNKHDVKYTKEFQKDLCKLNKHPSIKFIQTFSWIFMKKKFDPGKFEVIKDLTREQLEILGDNKLCRFEYREGKNLRCIFCVDSGYTDFMLLCAFIEDGSRKKGPDSYAYNISRAIEIYQMYN